MQMIEQHEIHSLYV